MLGLPEALHKRTPRNYLGKENVDLHQGFYYLYMYCNLVRARLVGDIMVLLLRTVVYFLLMQKSEFEAINVLIRDVLFKRGKVEVILVF